MFKRRKTVTVSVANVKIGSSAPVVIQSMTKVLTTDIEDCVQQINQLVEAGCELVRVSLPFETGKNKRAAVKIVDDRGIESLKIVEL